MTNIPAPPLDAPAHRLTPEEAEAEALRIAAEVLPLGATPVLRQAMWDWLATGQWPRG